MGMANYKLREEVIQLRLQGQTYSQIKRQLNVPKATLSDWLRNFPLSDSQYKALLENRHLSEDLRREKFRTTMANKRLITLTSVYETQKLNLSNLTTRELLIAGLFLYWGEGSKRRGVVSVSNTDYRILKFSIFWMTSILKIPKDKIKASLHLYVDMNPGRVIDYWSKILDLPKEQFTKPYIKSSNRTGLTYKSYGHGTCNIIACNVKMSDKVAMSIKAIAENYGAWNNKFWYN